MRLSVVATVAVDVASIAPRPHLAGIWVTGRIVLPRKDLRHVSIDVLLPC